MRTPDDKKNNSDKKEIVFKSKLPIPKDSKLSPIRTFRNCLPGTVQCSIFALFSSLFMSLKEWGLNFTYGSFSTFVQILRWTICERRTSRRVLSAAL
jgi:hypothetical protein